MMKHKMLSKKIITYITLTAFCALVLFAFIYSYYYQYMTRNLDFMSRYTFTTTIDTEYNIVANNNPDSTRVNNIEVNDVSEVSEFHNFDLERVANIWLKEFTSQYSRKYVPFSKSIRNTVISPPTILDKETNTVLLKFSTTINDIGSDFFSSWDGVTNNNILKCEWVVSFLLNDNFDNTATIYVTSIMTPEDYGITQYNAHNTATKEDTAPTDNELANYSIKDNSLYVTYDGGERYLEVPVSVNYLKYEDENKTRLKTGSYIVSNDKTAFVYGGIVSGNSKIPITLIYSNDKGENWTTCELDNIYNSSYYYIAFFDEYKGVIVCGYGNNDTTESSKIYSTKDGGETWNTIGSGPTTNILKGILFINENIGFFCYNYAEGMDSNLYKTTDGGKTFSKVLLESQELDSSAANSTENVTSPTTSVTTPTSSHGSSSSQLTWADVYKEALVPIIDSKGILTIYLTQGNSVVYNEGKTAAKYQSTDNGNTWKYIGQLEIENTTKTKNNI